MPISAAAYALVLLAPRLRLLKKLCHTLDKW